MIRDLPERRDSSRREGEVMASGHTPTNDREHMKIKRMLVGSVLLAGIAAGALGAAGAASADPTAVNGTDRNPTTNDAMGFGVNNAMKDWNAPDGDYGDNGDARGIGIYRSQDSGAVVKSVSGKDRQIAATDQGAVTLQHPDIKNGNKVEPQTKAGK